MAFSSRQLSPNKWGIYSGTNLLATVSCQQTCETIMANLANNRRDVPSTELNDLYKVPKLQRKSKSLMPTVSKPPVKPSVKTSAKKRARRSAAKAGKGSNDMSAAIKTLRTTSAVTAESA